MMELIIKDRDDVYSDKSYWQKLHIKDLRKGCNKKNPKVQMEEKGYPLADQQDAPAYISTLEVLEDTAAS